MIRENRKTPWGAENTNIRRPKASQAQPPCKDWLLCKGGKGCSVLQEPVGAFWLHKELSEPGPGVSAVKSLQASEEFNISKVGSSFEGPATFRQQFIHIKDRNCCSAWQKDSTRTTQAQI